MAIKEKIRKKKRSAKQLANDKRLGRMAKKRAAAARKKNPKKKTAKRKAKRKANPKKRTKSHLWLIFRCRGKTVHYFNGGWPISRVWGARDKGARYVTKGAAESHARRLAKKRGARQYQIGVASGDMTSVQIATQCNPGK